MSMQRPHWFKPMWDRGYLIGSAISLRQNCSRQRERVPYLLAPVAGTSWDEGRYIRVACSVRLCHSLARDLLSFFDAMARRYIERGSGGHDKAPPRVDPRACRRDLAGGRTEGTRGSTTSAAGYHHHGKCRSSQASCQKVAEKMGFDGRLNDSGWRPDNSAAEDVFSRLAKRDHVKV
jgi:hypothetical protein